MPSKYEREVYDCMNPTLDLLERTQNPHHRAILKNYCRHVHLEGALMFEEITAPDMMADDPVYHITWGDKPFQVKGRKGVFDFYNSIDEIVLWNSGDQVAVADWGIADEMWFHQMSTGAELKKLGHKIEKDDGLYLVDSLQAFIRSDIPAFTCTIRRDNSRLCAKPHVKYPMMATQITTAIMQPRF